jgi:DNA-binding beta-propeller fold protein YncE
MSRGDPYSPTGIAVEQVGRYESGQFDEDAAEIIAHDPAIDDLFVVNAEAGGVDVLDVDDPTEPRKVGALVPGKKWEDAGEVTNVALSAGVLAVAVGAVDPHDDGRVLFYDAAERAHLGGVAVGPTPDMVAFTDDEYALVACAGEPGGSYAGDRGDRNGDPGEAGDDGGRNVDGDRDDRGEFPRGAVAIVDLSDGAAAATSEVVDFAAFDGREDELRERGVRITAPGATFSEDAEPEYLAVGRDGERAYAVLQPNNAVAVLDVAAAEWIDVHPLGYKDYSSTGNELDASDVDRITIRNWPLHGMYQPDAIVSYETGGEEYLVTANEGAMRAFETATVADLDLDPAAFDLEDVAGVDSVADLQRPEHLGNLKVTTERGDVDGDGQHEELYAFGGRSFSIWTTEGERVFDSGGDFEYLVAMHHPEYFNVDGLYNEPFVRSTEKGPEPEGVDVGQVGERHYAFVGLERVSGLVVYDVTDPRDATFVQYVSERDFDVDPVPEIAEGPGDASDAGDLGPEGVTFVPAAEAPGETALVVVGNELSGTTTLFAVHPAGG